MAKEKISFEQFLTAVEPDYQEFIVALHNYLLDHDCKAKIEQKSSGYFVSYAHGTSKKSVVNFLFRKRGMIARIYATNVHKYPKFIETLPNEMMASIAKAPVCKRLAGTADCSSACSMGYDFIAKGEHFQKCKYNCFMFDVSNDNNPYIRAFVENEIKERAA